MEYNKKLVATTFAGLEQVLSDELVELGARGVQAGRRSVYFYGDDELVYRANYSLRTALRVLVPIREFNVFKPNDLYFQAGKIKWEDLFDSQKSFAIQAKVFGSIFQNSMYAALRVKDAIADRFRRIKGKRPSVNSKNPQIQINLHISDNKCTLSLDSSGESLHRRGYRNGNHESPINEVLAAGLIKLSGWSGSEALGDPMCGSGTLVIEAAMMAKNILPGEIRDSYSFQNWKNFDYKLFDRIKKNTQHKKINFKIFGSDISRYHINSCRQNAKKAMVEDALYLKIADFRRSSNENNLSFLIFNPPYGERLRIEDQKLYEVIGERLKHNFTGSTAWIISTTDCLKSIGLKPSKKMSLLNGKLQCSFRKYELFKGSFSPDKYKT